MDRRREAANVEQPPATRPARMLAQLSRRLAILAVVTLGMAFMAGAGQAAPLVSHPASSLFPNWLTSVACPSTTQCTAVDDWGQERTYNPAAPHASHSATVDPFAADTGQQLDGIACPSTTGCVAVDGGVREVTFNPLSPGSPTPVKIYPRVDALYSVACPSTTECTAVGPGGLVVTFNPISPGGAAATILAGTIPLPLLQGVACPSATQCTAISQELVHTFNPNSPASATSMTVDRRAGVESIACPSSTQCTAVDPIGSEITFDPSTSEGETSARIARGPCGPHGFACKFSAIACPSTSQCTGVTLGGQQVTFNPAAPSRVVAATIERHGLLSVACPDATLCTAVGQSGRVVTFNPTKRVRAASAVTTRPHRHAVGIFLSGPLSELNTGTEYTYHLEVIAPKSYRHAHLTYGVAPCVDEAVIALVAHHPRHFTFSAEFGSTVVMTESGVGAQIAVVGAGQVLWTNHRATPAATQVPGPITGRACPPGDLFGG